METCTGTLTQEQLIAEIDAVITFLGRLGKNDLLVSYAFGCNLKMDELYKELPLALTHLRGFIYQSIQDGAFSLGEAELYIESADRAVFFTICHESDIHLATLDSGIFEQMTAEWKARGYSPYRMR